MWNSRVHFTTTQDNTLVEMISKRAAIFDPGHKLYKDHTLRDRNWKEISSKVGRNLVECKKRWRSVRDTYGRMKRLQKLKPDKKYTKWPLANHLTFLDNVDAERGHIKGTISREDVNVTQNSQLEDYSSKCLFNQNPMTDLEESLDDSICGNGYPSNTFTQNSSVSLADASDHPPHAETSTNIGQATLSHNELSTVLEQKAADRMEILKEILKLKVPVICDDPVDAFFYGMAASVKKMSPELIAEAKLKVCKIIVDLELKAAASQEGRSAEIPMMCSSQNLIYPKGEPEDIESAYDQTDEADDADILEDQFELDIHKFE